MGAQGFGGKVQLRSEVQRGMGSPPPWLLFGIQTIKIRPTWQLLHLMISMMWGQLHSLSSVKREKE
jgi:hypothetical protein